MVLQHKSKLRVHMELKWEIWFEDFFEYVKGAPSELFLKISLGYPWVV